MENTIQRSASPSHLLSIPTHAPQDWPASFKSAQLNYAIPSDQSPPSETDSPSELSSWLDKLMKTPPRQSFYLGEALKVHIILSLTEPATLDESTEQRRIQDFLKESLSINLQGNLLPSGPIEMSSIRSESQMASTRPSSQQNVPAQPSSLNRSQQPYKLISPTHAGSQELHQSSKLLQLFTASLSHFKAESSTHPLNPIAPNHLQKRNSSNVGAHVSCLVAKLANQWLVVWKVECEMVITYHSTQPPLCDPSGPSILTTPLIPDSPPNLHPRSSLPRVGDCGFESAIEIDLFDGMGRDVSVSLTRPLTTAGNSNSAYQVEPTQNPQSKRPGSTSIRYSHSHSIPKITSGLVNPSRSDDYLPTFPEERSQTAHPIHAARRAFSNSYSKESTPIILTPQEIEPSASGVPFLDKKLTTMIPIVDPFILKADTIAPQHRLKPRELTVDQLNHPEIRFIEMEQLSNPMLTLELCYQGDVIGTFDEEFLVESLDVKLEEQGLLPEFDNFFTSTIKIMPIHPTQPSGDNFPYRISRNEVYSWIYIVQIDRADTLSEQAPHHDSSFSQYGSPSVNIISLPPSTLISSVRSAFKHQKTGIPIVDEGLHVSEDENLSNSPAAGRADDTQGTGSSGWGGGKPHITTRGLRNSYQRGLDNLPESEARLSSENEHPKPAGVFYLLSITISGKIISKDSRIESTGPISATWTSLLSSHDLSDSTTLDLRRKLNNESSEAAAMSWSGDEQAEKLAVTDLILPEAYGIGQPLKRSVFPHSGLVAGSKRHTASNLINALQELSSFQRSTYAAGLPLTLERSRTQKKQLSPLAIRHDSDFVQQKALSDDPSFSDSLTSASLSMMNSGRRFIPNTRQRTPTSTASHSSPQLPEPAHQPSEIDPKTGAGYPGDFKSNTPRGPSRASKRVPPVLIGSSFAQELHTSRSGALDDGTGRGQGDMMIQVNVSSPNGGDGTNRFKLMSEFAVEIIVFNRSSSSIIAQSPFKVKVLTNDYLLRAPHVSLQSGSPEAARQPYLFASVPPVHGDAGHHANASAGSGCAGGIVSLDEDIQIGPLRNGECQAVKIRLIGLKPGIFQLHGIHFVALPQPPPPPAPSHHHHHHHHHPSQQQLSQFILVDPLVILIE